MFGLAKFGTDVRTATRRVLRYVARPVRQDEGAEGLVAEPYRGYGNRNEIFLVGRVYRQFDTRAESEAGDLRAGLERLVRRGAAGEMVTAHFAGAVQQAVTDRGGYFTIHMRLATPPPADRLWHHVELSLALPSGGEATATAEVFVPPQTARFVVISDIDDTVMLTGVAQKTKMFWRLFAQGAESRVAFPGVTALYRALHGEKQNPILYVSRGPWSIYSMLQAFFSMHDIPVGPILFLRDWGVSLKRPLPRRSPRHKLELIRNMLELYDDLPFVLIGDSGQHDPETYAQIVHEHPGRVAAVYIRNVHHDSARTAAIEELAQQVLDAGSSLLLAADSVAMAKDAAARGLVPEAAVADVADERQAETGKRGSRRIRTLSRKTRRETQRAVAEGELDRTLDAPEREPPNTLVESEADSADSAPAGDEPTRS